MNNISLWTFPLTLEHVLLDREFNNQRIPNEFQSQMELDLGEKDSSKMTCINWNKKFCTLITEWQLVNSYSSLFSLKIYPKVE